MIFHVLVSETHSDPSQITKMELLYNKSYRLKAINNFCKELHIKVLHWNYAEHTQSALTIYNRWNSAEIEFTISTTVQWLWTTVLAVFLLGGARYFNLLWTFNSSSVAYTEILQDRGG